MNYKEIYKHTKSKYLKFMFFFLLIGLIIGFFLYLKINKTELLNNLKDITTSLKTTHINFLINHILILSLIIMASLTIIGLIIIPIYLIFEGISLCFNICSFSFLYGIDGFIYSLLYLIITKGVYLILLFIIFKNIIIIIKDIINKVVIKDNSNFLIIKKIEIIGICILGIILNDLFIYFWAHKIISYFGFLLN